MIMTMQIVILNEHCEWHCPDCESHNQAPGRLDMVKCDTCNGIYAVSFYEVEVFDPDERNEC
jgi:hypothetical protein